MVIPTPIPLSFVRKLGGEDFVISAASGLVKSDQNFLVVADDHLSVGMFPVNPQISGKLFPLLQGILPTDPKQRKKVKPDWECLVILPGTSEIVVIPSGSKPNRTVGILFALEDEKVVTPRPIDFSDLFSSLENHYSELNIEGAVVVGSVLKLFQRGNGAKNQNGFIDLNFSAFQQALRTSRKIRANHILGITDIKLEPWQNHPVGFTDVCYDSSDHIYYLAVAESSASTFDDGPYMGALLGKLTLQGDLVAQQEITCPAKPEGLWVEPAATNADRFYVVTDADDPATIATLYAGTLPF